MIDLNDTEIKRALAFSTAAHAAVNQRRKYTDEPYIVHPIRLGDDAAWRPWATDAAVIALYGHDTVEDTRQFVTENGGKRVESPSEWLLSNRDPESPTGGLLLVEGITVALWRQMFGDEPADIIDGLTDTAMPWDGNRKTRMAINREHAWAQPAITQNCKLIDIKDNLRDIGRNDPQFAPKYFREKMEVFEGLTKADSDLRQEVQEVFDDYFKRRIVR